MAREPDRAALKRAARRGLAAVATCAAIAVLGACATEAPPPEQPARIVAPDAASRDALAAAVASALGHPAGIAPDALVGDDELLIEPAILRDAAGVPVDGRRYGRPERFRLLTDGHRCILVHDLDGRRLALAGVRCAPAPRP